MTRDEFVTRCDDLSSETKYSSKPWHIWLAEMTAHDAEQRAEISALRTLCLEVYQVVGSLAGDAGMFGHTATTRVLDNLSMAGVGKPLPHKDLLPFPSSREIMQLREALTRLLECVEDECRIDHHGYCQNHFVTIPCVVVQAQQALKEEP